jgi:hypothetical protein
LGDVRPTTNGQNSFPVDGAMMQAFNVPAFPPCPLGEYGRFSVEFVEHVPRRTNGIPTQQNVRASSEVKLASSFLLQPVLHARA